MSNKRINKQAIKRIAIALEELNGKAVFVGGAVVVLYTDDTTADDVRETKDIDISIEISGLGELELIRTDLTNKGFIQTAEDKVVCRFRYDDIKVDVMSTKNIGWAPSNRWFKPGFQNIRIIHLDGIDIRIFSLPYFLASKFEAFHNRGSLDPRTSHDLEDIIYLLEYTSDIEEQIVTFDNNVKHFLVRSFKEIIDDDYIQEAILGNLGYEQQTDRFNKIIKIIKQIVLNLS